SKPRHELMRLLRRPHQWPYGSQASWIGDRRREELVDLKSALLQGWRHGSGQLQQDRDDEHRHRRRKAEETLRERADQIEGHGSNDGCRDRRHVRLATLL